MAMTPNVRHIGARKRSEPMRHTSSMMLSRVELVKRGRKASKRYNIGSTHMFAGAWWLHERSLKSWKIGSHVVAFGSSFLHVDTTVSHVPVSRFSDARDDCSASIHCSGIGSSGVVSRTKAPHISSLERNHKLEALDGAR